MNDTPFTLFIELITFDQAIVTLEAQLATLEKELTALDHQEQKLLKEVESAKQAWQDAKKAVDVHELAMEELVQAEAAKKKRLESVTNHKEYQSIKAELDAIVARQRTVETELLDAWARVETATRLYEQGKQQHQTQLEQLQTQRTQKLQSKEDFQKIIQQRRQERAQKEQHVPAEWVEKYAAMRSRVQDPVVPVQQGSCSACFYKVSDQDMLMLARNKLLQCKGCHRFLYLQPTSPATQS